MNKASKKILSLALAVLLAVGSMAVGAPTVYAALPNPGVGKASDGIDFAALGGSGIYYGTYKHATSINYNTPTNNTYETDTTPILWRVMGEENDNGKLTMMSEYVLDGKQFDSSSIQWEYSAINTWLNGSFFPDSFLPAESGYVVAPVVITTKFQDGNPTGHTITPTKIWLPATNNSNNNGGRGDVTWHADLRNTPQVSLGDNQKNIAYLKDGTTADRWWLRSPYSGYSDTALDVNVNGNASNGHVSRSRGVRPAFQFHPSSVLFTSEIKSGADVSKGETAADSNYSAAGGGAKNFKLTVLNTGITAPSIAGYTSGSGTVTVASGGSVALTSTGNTEKLVYKIVENASGTRNIVGYGVGDATDLTLSGTGLTAGGDYTLYVWAQKDNAINSHEGSQPVYFTLDVQRP